MQGILNTDYFLLPFFNITATSQSDFKCFFIIIGNYWNFSPFKKAAGNYISIGRRKINFII